MGFRWRWRSAPALPRGEAASDGALAFGAILREPRLLYRLPRGQARRLAEQADRFAGALLEDAVPPGARGPARASAERVRRAARRWLSFDELRVDSLEALLDAAGTEERGLGRCLTMLHREAPEFDDGAGALAVAAVLELAPGLPRLPHEHSSVLLLAASRQAAGFLRGERSMPHARAGGERAAIEAALGVVDRICADRRMLPFEARVAPEPPVRAEQSIRLWRDAGTCVVRFAGTASARRWEHARDVQAFGAVLAHPRILDSLVADERARAARDAASVARRLLEGPAAPGAELRPAAERVHRICMPAA